MEYSDLSFSVRQTPAGNVSLVLGLISGKYLVRPEVLRVRGASNTTAFPPSFDLTLQQFHAWVARLRSEGFRVGYETV